jgi:hypothetical protein
MAKVRHPFLSLDLHGSFTNGITFSHAQKTEYAKGKSKPGNPNTVEQRIQRMIYQDGVKYYRQMNFDPDDKVAISRLGKLHNLRLSPYQIFMAIYLIMRKWVSSLPWAYHVRTMKPGPGQLYIRCTFITGLNLIVGISLSPQLNATWYPMHEIGMSGDFEATIGALTKGVIYYFRFVYAPWVAAQVKNSGIYRIKL